MDTSSGPLTAAPTLAAPRPAKHSAPFGVAGNDAASQHDRLSAVGQAVRRTGDWLAARQHEEGYWVAELEGDTILESEYILLLAYLGRHRTPRARAAARYMLGKQLPDGGWTLYPGGRMDVSASVKAYFALKLTGHDPGAEYMARARAAIRAAGGADAVNSFTRFYLAMLGQIGYEHCPEVPPEMVLLPNWSPINMYSVSSWTRTIIVPLSIISACQPVAHLDASMHIRELCLQPPEKWPVLRGMGKQAGGLFGWDRFFRGVDRLLKWYRRSPVSMRKRALRKAQRWMVERFQGSDGLGAIFPPMIWSIIALRCLGYDDDSPELRYCYRSLEGLVIEEGDTARLQPCKSPVWDTAITLRALLDGDRDSDDPAVVRGIEWLLDQQITRHGDWSRRVQVEPGGWCFEFANDYYPDLDDTAMASIALASQYRQPRIAPATSDNEATRLRLRGRDAREQVIARTTRALQLAEQWMAAMQNRDGGWGAFDRDNNMEFLCNVPFADHNAMIDPSTPDLAARVLEALGTLGRRLGEEGIDRAIAYLRKHQESDGSWFGRWGVNYIYGTWQVLTGMRAVGVPADDEAIAGGAQWLLGCQQPCGGWGETPDSYEDPSLRGTGETTASQTAWAVLGLVEAGMAQHPAVQRGIDFLVRRQQTDGAWKEEQFTGTGFPRVFYLRYHYYPIYFPMMALSRWAEAVAPGLPVTGYSVPASTTRAAAG